ncbi:hypothetical protein HYALB_00012004 [Hymenoscyphus albidus]|uniref:Uncharacterized protein n=1 Tax=Hymenoscyphus albidus TaxID=595503 RepID=A0A9N9LPI4_9HELO|nr:hypothetical protein HYALB_00012004 [Hymenoscyphus albidus]
MANDFPMEHSIQLIFQSWIHATKVLVDSGCSAHLLKVLSKVCAGQVDPSCVDGIETHLLATSTDQPSINANELARQLEKPAEGYMAKVIGKAPYQDIARLGNVRPKLIKKEPFERTKVIDTALAQDINMLPISTHALAKQISTEVEGLKEQMNDMRTYMLQLLTGMMARPAT